jgi:ubiquinone/menaquinone biosynthesis C-methylase UbiE
MNDSRLPFTADFSYLSERAAAEYDAKRFRGLYGRLRSRLQIRALSQCVVGLGSSLSVLEVACGTGRLTTVLIDRFPVLTASDISPAMLAVARRRLGSRVAFAVADARALPFQDKSADLVAAFFLLGHAPPHIRQAMLEEFHRVSRRLLVVSVPLVDEVVPKVVRRLMKRQYPFRSFYPTTRLAFTAELGRVGFRPTRWIPSARGLSGTWFVMAESLTGR